jgi:glycosyltransferase involved in cell wall biosynthesis
VRVAPEAGSIADGLRELVRMSDAERTAMGGRGRALVEREFAWPEIAERMAEVYRWALGGGARPTCVAAA